MPIVNPLLESLLYDDPGEIESNILNVYEAMKMLGGDVASKTKYAISYSNISNNAVAKDILDSIASKVTAWDKYKSSVRYMHDASERRKYVFLVASIIKPLAIVLRDMALQTRDPVAKKSFTNLVKLHYSIQFNGSFAELSDLGYSSWLSAIEIGVPTRHQTPISKDYGAQSEMNYLMDCLALRVNAFRQIVIEMLQAANITTGVSDRIIDSAAAWIMMYNIFKNQIFGSDLTQRNDDGTKKTPWFNENDSLAEKLYKYVKYRLTNTDQAREANADSAYILTDQNIVRKEMSRLGQNTDQLSILNERTRFTSKCYYKLFAIDGLREFSYRSADGKKDDPIGKMVYKIVARLFHDANLLHVKLTGDDDYEKLADSVKKIFAQYATTSTEKSLNLRATLISLLDEFKHSIPKGSDQIEKFAVDIYGSSIPMDPVKVLRDAINGISRKILFVGSNVCNGQTVDNASISATRLPAPVVTIGSADVTDRNKTDELNTAGKLSKACFEYRDNVLTVKYDPSTMSSTGVKLTDSDILSIGEYDVDNIMAQNLSSISDDYVSSKLIPAAVSGSQAWIMFYGIVAYAFNRYNDLSDSVDQSALISRENQILANAKAAENTKLSSQAKQRNIVTNRDFADGLGKCHFMDAEQANQLDTRIEWLTTTIANVPDSMVNSLTKIRGVCDKYTKAVTAFAKTMQEHNADKAYPVKRLRQSIYQVTPNMRSFIVGGPTEVNRILVDYLAKYGEGDSAVSEDMNKLNDVIHVYSSLKTAIKQCPDNKRLWLLVLAQYMGNLDTAIAHFTAQSSKESDDSSIAATLLGQLRKCLPENFDALHQSVLDCQWNVNKAANKQQVIKNNIELIQTATQQFIAAGEPVMPELSQSIGTLFSRLVSEENTDALVVLKEALMSVVDYIKSNNVTVSMLDEVIKTMASSMTGDPRENATYLEGLKFSKFVYYVKVFRMAMTAAGKSDSTDEEMADDLADIRGESIFSLDRGGEAPMDEVPFDVGAANLETTRRTDENAVTGAQDFHAMAAEGTFLENLRNTVYKLSEADEAYDEAKSGLDELYNMARQYEWYTDPQPNSNIDVPYKREYDLDKRRIDELQSSGEVSNALIDHAKKLAYKKYIASATNEHLSNSLAKYSEDYPSFTGIVDAINTHRVSAAAIDRCIKYLNAAADVRDSVIKYNSYKSSSDDDRSELLQYAYTDSDETAVAQIMCVLGSYIAAPNAYELEDLVESMEHIDGFIRKYSQNPMSVKVSGAVVDKLRSVVGSRPQDTSSESYSEQLRAYRADVATAIVDLINQLGGFVLSSDNADVAAQHLGETENIRRPSDNPAYGKATDSFARSQLRAQLSKTLKTEGGSDEAAVRQSYIKHLANDLSNNQQLAKFAYTLGRAFNTYDEILRDERVDTVDQRSLSGSMKSLAEKGLFKNLGSNDLQREIVSAIIDDERTGDKSYPTVSAVVDAAMTGGSFNSYNQMYSTKVGSEENIFNDTKSTSVAFDANGNRTKQKAVPLNNQTVTALATQVTDGAPDMSGASPFNDIPELVHDVRMCIFEKLYRNYGSIANDGTAILNDYYAKKSNDMMKAAMQKMYALCNDMDTPIADIILVGSSVGQRIGRLAVMDYVRDQLSKNGDVDLDTAGMVSDEPNAYPQMMSDEESKADDDWIDGITELLGYIPEDFTTSNVLTLVDMYNGSDLDRQKLAESEPTRIFLRIVDGMLRLDTATGVPVGFFGNDSSRRKNRIKRIFEILCSYKTDDSVTWEDCAQQLKERFENTKSKELRLGDQSTSDAAMRKIYHRRLNPFYSVKVNSDKTEYQRMVGKLKTDGVLVSAGRIMKLCFPKMSFDAKTFDYIVNLAIGMRDAIGIPDSTRLFLTALMMVLNGFRPQRYVKLADEMNELVSSKHGLLNDAMAVVNSSSVVAPVKLTTPDNASEVMIKTNLGWLTDEAYKYICAKAYVMAGGDKTDTDKFAALVDQNFATVFNELSAGGHTTVNVDDFKPVPEKGEKPSGNGSSGEKGSPAPATGSEGVPAPVAGTAGTPSPAASVNGATKKTRGRNPKNPSTQVPGAPTKRKTKRVPKIEKPVPDTSGMSTDTDEPITVEVHSSYEDQPAEQLASDADNDAWINSLLFPVKNAPKTQKSDPKNLSADDLVS